MSDDIALKVESLSKSFRLPHEQHSGIKQLLVNMFKGKRGYETQEVLKDINFEVKKGQFFGVVGRNGSGKSTLLKLMAGIYSPDKGAVSVNGSLTPFIELGVGFNPELTGRENVFLNGALLGFSRDEMDAMYDNIVQFAELERFMDQKLKNYSSGMQVRLAFSIAIRAEGDILLLDEVLAVGDVVFQQKCYEYFSELKKSNKTVVLVSHDTNVLRRYCTSGILIENGRLIEAGNIDHVTDRYSDVISEGENHLRRTDTDTKKRHGNGTVVVEKVELFDSDNNRKNTFNDQDGHIVIKVNYTTKRRTDAPVFGITIVDQDGHKIFASNNLWLSIPSKSLEEGDNQSVTWKIPNIFNNGAYNISPAVSDQHGTVVYDWVEDMKTFKVMKNIKSTSIININHSMEIK